MHRLSKLRSVTAGPRSTRSVPVALRRALAPALAVAVLATLAACQPKSPEEKVAALRGDYSAELNSFNVVQTPMVDESGMESDMDAGEPGTPPAADQGGTAASGAASGDATADGGVTEEVPMRQDVMLDVVVRKITGSERLPGLTLDVYQVDSDEHDKASYRIWVDTSTLNKGSREAISYVLQDVDYAPGDKFAVEVRQNVPPELYGEYKEFAELQDAKADGN